MRPPLIAAAVLSVGVFATACGSSSSSTAAPTTLPGAPSSSSRPSAKESGPLDVLYAGSLVDLMDDYVGPAFHSATGYTVAGTSGDSGALANEIKGKTIVGDVFISASPSKDLVLEGAANGNWVSWYATFATSPLVVGYSRASRFASGFRTKPWYEAIDQPGLLLGRTDPATDPKGVLTVSALQRAAKLHDEPALESDATNSSEVFPEDTLVGRLQSGQLDAGFFYSVEATAAHFPFVPVTGVGSLAASYTITILAGAPHLAAADAFVGYLLGYDGRQELSRAGLQPASPLLVSGQPPSNIEPVLAGG